MSHDVLMGLLHDYMNYSKEIMNIGSDARTMKQTKCIISKKQMLNACSVLFSRNGIYTL